MDKEAESKPQEEPESFMASVTETESSKEPTEPELNEHKSTEHESVQWPIQCWGVIHSEGIRSPQNNYTNVTEASSL